MLGHTMRNFNHVTSSITSQEETWEVLHHSDNSHQDDFNRLKNANKNPKSFTPALFRNSEFLENLLAPLTVSEFKNQYWEQQPYLFRASKQGRNFKEIVSTKILDNLIATDSIDHTKVIAADATRPTLPLNLSGNTKTEKRILFNDNIHHYFRNKYSIVFLASELYIKTVDDYCRKLEEGFSSKVTANLFLTPPHAQGFADHWDTQEILAVQVEGRKYWQLYNPTYTLPTVPYESVKQSHPFDVSQLTPCWEGWANAGDILYIPRGFIHHAYTEEEHSLHIISTLQPYTWGDAMKSLTSHAIQTCLDLPEFRSNFPLGKEVNSELLLQNWQKISDEMKRLLTSSDPTSIVKHNFLDSLRVPSEHHILERSFNEVSIENILDTDTFQRESCAYFMAEDQQIVILKFYKHTIELPLESKSTLEYILTRDSFSISQLPKSLTADKNKVLIKTLVDHGILHRL